MLFSSCQGGLCSPNRLFQSQKIFFRFSLHKIPKEDLDFILSRYFPQQSLKTFQITKYEYYFQREAICQLFGYKLWSQELSCQLKDRSKLSVNVTFLRILSLVNSRFFADPKIVRPRYTTLQTIVSSTLSEERQRLKSCLQQHLTNCHKENLKQLIKKENTLSELAALKQDVKNFKLSMMRLEIKKHDTLKPLHALALEILPYLDISQQNVAYYASLTHHYTIYELEQFDIEQTYLYLLCYVLKRYQQINDNLSRISGFQSQKIGKRNTQSKKPASTRPRQSW